MLEDYQEPERVNEILEITCPIMLVLYALLFAAVSYNTVRFVYRDDRHKNFYIMYFYSLVYVIVVLRVTWLVLILCVTNNYYVGQEQLVADPLTKSIYYIDMIATYCELLTGI